jgi:hypothetical protein
MADENGQSTAVAELEEPTTTEKSKGKRGRKKAAAKKAATGRPRGRAGRVVYPTPARFRFRLEFRCPPATGMMCIRGTQLCLLQNYIHVVLLPPQRLVPRIGSTVPRTAAKSTFRHQ